MIIFNEPTVIITYDKDRAMLRQKWVGYTPAADLRKAVNATFEFLSENKLYRILSDITQQKVVSPREQDYTKNAAAEYYRETGNLKIAFITNPGSVAMAASRYNRTLTEEIGININSFFDCEDKALMWLLESCDELKQD